jgi:hypothetical protein
LDRFISKIFEQCFEFNDTFNKMYHLHLFILDTQDCKGIVNGRCWAMEKPAGNSKLNRLTFAKLPASKERHRDAKKEAKFLSTLTLLARRSFSEGGR